MSSETDLSRNQGIQNQRNSFSRGFPLPFNVETLQAFGALFQIWHYYRKFLYCKPKMLCIFSLHSCTTFCFDLSTKDYYCKNTTRRRGRIYLSLPIFSSNNDNSFESILRITENIKKITAKITTERGFPSGFPSKQ
jgi:hypothetical protein